MNIREMLKEKGLSDKEVELVMKEKSKKGGDKIRYKVGSLNREELVNKNRSIIGIMWFLEDRSKDECDDKGYYERSIEEIGDRCIREKYIKSSMKGESVVKYYSKRDLVDCGDLEVL